LYFASLGGDGRVLPDTLASAVAKDFGSVDRWRREFVGIANGLAGGSAGCCSPMFRATGGSSTRSRRSMISASQGECPYSPSTCTSTRNHLEFGANANAYIAAFMRNIDWSAVKLRYEDANQVAPPRPLEQKEFADTPSIPSKRSGRC